MTEMLNKYKYHKNKLTKNLLIKDTTTPEWRININSIVHSVAKEGQQKEQSFTEQLFQEWSLFKHLVDSFVPFCNKIKFNYFFIGIILNY